MIEPPPTTEEWHAAMDSVINNKYGVLLDRFRYGYHLAFRAPDQLINALTTSTSRMPLRDRSASSSTAGLDLVSTLIETAVADTAAASDCAVASIHIQTDHVQLIVFTDSNTHPARMIGEFKLSVGLAILGTRRTSLRPSRFWTGDHLWTNVGQYSHAQAERYRTSPRDSPASARPE